MDTKVRLAPHGKMPRRMSAHASGYDLFAAIQSPVEILPRGIMVVPCGFSIELVDGFEAQIRSRSGLAAKYGIFCLNGVGTIDADYRGEVGAVMANFKDMAFVVEPGMRIAQMVICSLPNISLLEANELNKTDRGNCGYGSTGSD